MAVEVPLFPLGTVLFPHMPLRLQIFEDRYRTMLRHCLDSGTSFGVLAIREGHEVGEGAVPYSVGTLARLSEVDELDDGRYRLVVVGASRFRVESFSNARPYLCGTISYLEDRGESARDAETLTRALLQRFRPYIATLRGAEPSGDELDVPEEPELLSYLVAASLRVETARRQRLLEIDLTEARLRECLALLRREQSLLEHLLARSDQAGAASSN